MKGQITSTMLLYVIKFGIVVVMVIFLKGITPYLITVQTDTNALEANAFIHLLLNKALVYETQANLYPGVIDLQKIVSLGQQLSYGQRLAAKVTLSNATGHIIAEEIFQNEMYNLFSVLVGKRGPGGTVQFDESFYVLYRENDKLLPGKLSVSVVMPHG